MKEQLARIRSEALAAFEQAQSAAELDSLRVQYLGKKGELTAVLKMMGKLSAEERPAMGQLANEVRSALEAAIEAAAGKLEAQALEQRLKDEALDVTIPGRKVKLGHKHPMYLALDELKEQDRQIVLLYAAAGMKHREVAKALGLPLATELSRYSRSMKRLQQLLTVRRTGG